jgi:hypothetical protein
MDKLEEYIYRAWDEYYSQTEARIKHRAAGKYTSPWDSRNPHYKAFKRIAETCIKYEINPTDFVIANFKILGPTTAYIIPEDLVKPEALHRYLSYENDQIDVEIWKHQVLLLTDMACRMVPSVYASEIDILSRGATPFPAWFRVLYPKPFNDGIFATFGDEAYAELRDNRKLRGHAYRLAPDNMAELQRRKISFGDNPGDTK